MYVCSDACLEARDKAVRKANKGRREARKRGVISEPIFRQKVFARDRWECGLCGMKVDKRLQYPDPMSASLDHITPISEGGEHTMRNVQCSHLRCNVKKAAGAGGQLRLFG